MEEIKITFEVTPFQAGVLMGLIMQAGDSSQRALDSVWQQLVEGKKRAEREAGVIKEWLPGGKIRITDKDGNMVIRDPFPYEIEGKE